jgi:hypothetical protein
MISSGILDPLKVVKTALVDASGVASLLSTSECVIVVRLCRHFLRYSYYGLLTL